MLRHMAVLGPTILLAPFAVLCSSRDEQGELQGMEWWWVSLTAAAENSGPALLKFFQV